LSSSLSGAPGGGKGTISKKMVKEFGFTHISTGDLLRTQILQETPTGLMARAYMNQGRLVPDEVVLGLLKEEVWRLEGQGKEKTGQTQTQNQAQTGSLLLDGFPRTVAQAALLGEWFPVRAVLSLHVPHETIAERMAQRWVHLQSGRTYAYDYNPPKTRGLDDLTGEPLQQRADDTPAVVLTRLKQYEASTLPLLQYYEHTPDCLGQASTVRTFEGKESDKIYEEVRIFLKDLGCQEV